MRISPTSTLLHQSTQVHPVSVLVVAGFHRSGTSLTSQLLQRAGLFMGDELIGANDSNPYGHVEDRAFVQIHEDLLADVGRTWHVDRPFTPSMTPARWQRMASLVAERRVHHDVWGFKDPRVCFFLGAWHHLVPEMKTLVVFRDVRECIWSLERRHATELFDDRGPVHLHHLFWERPDHALRMWTVHNRALVDWASSHRESTLVVPLSAIQLGAPVVAGVRQALGIPLSDVDTFEVFDPGVTTTPAVRPAVSDPLALDEAIEVWGALEDLAARDGSRWQLEVADAA